MTIQSMQTAEIAESITTASVRGSLNHAHLTVPIANLEEARRFYCEVIGLQEVEKPESLKVYPGFWVQLDNCQLHIGGENSSINRWDSGVHVAIEVPDLEDRRARLQLAGVKMSDMVYYPGYRRFEFRDPFGNRLELTTKASRCD
jgi:catechol 2,3-dioxygenase-like lactoylglutathione lyase family enzyme